MNQKPKILVTDDDARVRDVLRDALTQMGYRVVCASSGEETLRLIGSERFAVMLLDLKMPGMDGLEVLKALKGGGVEVEVVILTGYGDVESAVAAMKLGAYDYLQKPFIIAELDQVLKGAVQAHSLRRQRLAPQVTMDEEAAQTPMILGVDPKILGLGRIIEQVAPTDATILVTGESGTGKELVARRIHVLSRRFYGPLLVVDCPSVPASLFESEMFGHERGAFTGATSMQQGRLMEADGGTLFLDEVGEFPLEIQAKLLRFLEERKVTRIGGNRAVSIDARVISATNRDLTAMIEQGTFRLDLYYRLNVVQIDLPPLRERKGDIPLLVAYFVERVCRRAGIPGKVISPESLALLLGHAWPGNVRELENVITRACLLTPGHTITPESLPSYFLSGMGPSDHGGTSNIESLAELERQYIVEVLEQEQWNISRAARVLGIHRATLHRKLLALDLRPDNLREDKRR